LSFLTEIIAKVEDLIGSPGRVVSGGYVGGGVEGPPGATADGVVVVSGCGSGDSGDEEGADREVRRDKWRHWR